MQVGKFAAWLYDPFQQYTIMQKRSTVHSRTCCKKKSGSSQAPYLFFKAGRIYKHRIFHTQCKSMGSPDLLGFAVPFYLVQLICALLICEAFSDMPQVNRVPMRQTHKLKNSIPLKQLNKPCIVKKKKHQHGRKQKMLFFFS